MFLSIELPNSRREFLKLFSMIIAVITTIGSTLMFLFYAQQGKRVSLSREVGWSRVVMTGEMLEGLQKREADLLNDIALIRKQVERVQMDLVSLSARTLVPGQPEASAELAEHLSTMRTSLEKVASQMENLEKQSGTFENRMSKIETVILAEPQKALELPLLKRDLQALQQQFDRDLNALKGENARVYDLMKWLVGLMALVSLSLVGTAIGNVFKREREPVRNDEIKLPKNEEVSLFKKSEREAG